MGCQTIRVPDSPTVIARFLAAVDDELRRRGAAGAAPAHVACGREIRAPRARSAWNRRAAATATPGRPCGAHWTPLTVATLRDEGLSEIARQQSPVSGRGDAASGAQHVRALRDLLGSLPNDSLSASPADVASALVPIQKMLRWSLRATLPGPRSRPLPQRRHRRLVPRRGQARPRVVRRPHPGAAG